MSREESANLPLRRPIRLAVIWIDWYPYHVARFQGLLSVPSLAGRTAGIEVVGGVGVHAGLKFREALPPELPVTTLFPGADWSTLSQWTAARRVWRELSSADPEAVLVPGYYTLPGLAAALWARVHNRKSILMTESTSYDHPRLPWKEWAKGLLIRTLFDTAVTGGIAHRRYLHQLGFPPDRIGRFYDVVDTSGIEAEAARMRREFSPARFGLPDTPYFLYVGRLAEEKNVRTLVEAWTRYRRRGGDWPLVLVGDGPARQALEAQVAAGPFGGAVLFTGLRTSAELPSFYAFAGCFVLPSSREPWGLVVNEAMAAGLPVLVSDRCGSAEDLVQQQQNGFTFAPFDTTDLASRMGQIASMSAEARRRMGERSSELIRAYSPQAFGDEIASLMKR